VGRGELATGAWTTGCRRRGVVEEDCGAHTKLTVVSAIPEGGQRHRAMVRPSGSRELVVLGWTRCPHGHQWGR
jgi:hypothetical protein